MSTLLKQKQNTGKALEVRMEQVSADQYHVILAGMTVNHKSNCANGTCEGFFMFTENMTYKVDTFSSLTDANEVYEQFREQYVDC